jgi:hypothetical protein
MEHDKTYAKHVERGFSTASAKKLFLTTSVPQVQMSLLAARNCTFFLGAEKGM